MRVKLVNGREEIAGELIATHYDQQEQIVVYIVVLESTGEIIETGRWDGYSLFLVKD